jgi:hypothetical protein
VPDVGRNLALAVGALAGVVAGILLRRPRPPELAPTSDPRAEELRQRLATARAAAPESGAPGDAEPAPEAASASADDLDAMRRRVHAEGKAAAEEMRRSAEEAGRSD